jgi:pyrroline-5-carboxylate reductase
LTEAMTRAGVELGLTEDDAALLARQTAFGAGKMLAESGESAEALRLRVTSPGGTTEAAIKSMEGAGVPRSIVEAIKAAARRSEELGRQS